MTDAANKQTALILGRGLITAEAIYQEVRERVVRELLKGRRESRSVDLLGLARAVLEEIEPLLAEHLSRTDLAAWLAGFAWTATKFPPWFEWNLSFEDEGPPKPPGRGLILLPSGDDDPIVRFPLIEKAAESLHERGILSRGEFDAASETARLRSFTVAGEHTVATIDQIREALADVTREGASLQEFRAALEDRLGASPIGSAHLETVYRTNIQAAFRDGRETLASNPIVSEVFPYQEYIPIHDSRVEPEDKALGSLGIDGTGVYRREDPFWDQWTPPIHFNCRCGTNLLTIEAAARRGVREAQEWLETGQRPPLVSRLPHIPFQPQPGFGARGRVLT